VELDDALDQRETETQPVLRTRQRSFPPLEWLEDARQQVGIDADTRIANADHEVTALASDVQTDLAGSVAVLRGVHEQIADRL
jgi:hypothetical protein